MAERIVWECRVTNAEKASKLPRSQQQISTIANDLQTAIEQATAALQKCDPDEVPAVPTIKILPSDIECMPQEDRERGEPWPSEVEKSDR